MVTQFVKSLLENAVFYFHHTIGTEVATPEIPQNTQDVSFVRSAT
jgi:hypothetical protein